MAVDQCPFCGKPATLLCDYVCGREIAGWSECTREQADKVGRIDDYVEDKGLPCMTLTSRVFTCDKPICESCSTNVGQINASGQEGFHDTYDLCPAHKDRKDWAKGRFVNPTDTDVEPSPDPDRFKLFKGAKP